MGLRYVSYALPTTHAADAMRSIMLRGWGFGHPEVYLGYVFVAGYAAFLLTVSTLRVRSVN